MPLRKAYPIRFTYRGISDSTDATDVFLGAAQNLKNLIFDRDNPEWMVPRPGVTPITTFPGFNTPGFVSIHNTIEPLVYGMLATNRNAGHDEPFLYDMSMQAFRAISGVTNGNTPISPATSGAWSPPSLAAIGSRVIFTHPGFGGVGGLFFGFIDTSNFSLNTVGTTANGNALVTAVGSTIGVALGQTIAGVGIQADHDRVVLARGEAGAQVKGLEARQTQLDSENIATKSLLSNLQDTDFTTAVTRFQALQTSLQANYQLTAKVLHLSLLDFLA